MSTQIVTEIGSLVDHEGKLCVVVRMNDSTTWFQEPGDDGESYLLEERYAELRDIETREVSFKIFSQQKHLFTKIDGRRGLDPRIWKRI